MGICLKKRRWIFATMNKLKDIMLNGKNQTQPPMAQLATGVKFLEEMQTSVGKGDEGLAWGWGS